MRRGRWEEDARRTEEFKRFQLIRAESEAADRARYAAALESDNYLALQTAIVKHATELRKEQMRVSTDPTDPAYIDARPRKVWCNDVLIEGWTVADEFRRCVITPDGKVHNGSVHIERLSDAEVDPQGPAPEVPIDTGFMGMFVNVPDAKPAAAPVAPAEPAAKPAAAPKAKTGKRRR